MSGQLLLLCAAGWLALLLHDRRARGRSPRFALALLLGALLARVGDSLLFRARPDLLLAASGGSSILFLPVGPLLAARWPHAFACLPLPLALARLGCMAGGCCRGVSGEALPLFEVGGLLLLHTLMGRAPVAFVPGIFGLGFGALRLAQTPWRPAVSGVPVEAIAAAWLAGGVAALLWRAPGDAR